MNLDGNIQTAYFFFSRPDPGLRNHPFVDGNKRTAYGVAGLFLSQGGYDLGIKDAQAQITFFEDFAAGNVTRDAMAVFYRQNLREIRVR